VGWLAVTVVAALVVVGCLVAAAGPVVLKWPLYATAAAAAGLWLVITLFAYTFATVEAGHVGLVKTFSDYTGTMDPGFNTKLPWQSVDEANVRVQSHTILMDGQAGRGSAVSLETQPVYATVTLNYALDPTEVLVLYRTVGSAYYDSIIAPRVAQVFKSETVKYRTIDVAPNREKIRGVVQAELDRQLDDYGVHVVDFLINDLDFAPEFVRAITEKQVATQTAEAAREKVRQAEFEAQQSVETARGEAESQLIAARAEAEATRLLGRALAENPNVLQLRAIEKLNPNVQTIYLPSGNDFILNLPQSPAQP
jgi:regulator of protease activity HflC (stomatin/prohibitin superfamily)